jgi:hypothetical protein
MKQDDIVREIDRLSRKIALNLKYGSLADSIVGVQPMTGSVGKIFTIRHSYTPQPKYKFSRAKWYEADLWNSHHDLSEVRAWCSEHFGPQDRDPNAWSRWINYMNSTFKFRDERDYNWFVLRWGA